MRGTSAFWRPFLLAIILIARSFVLPAQPDSYQKAFEHDRDSALKELQKHPKPDTTRALALANLLDCASFLSQKRQLTPYYREAISLSRKLNYNKAEAVCLVWLGGYYKSLQKPDSALLYLDSAILVAGASNEQWPRRTRAFAHFQKALLFETQGNYYSALNDYFAALKDYDANDLYKQKIVFIRLASIYEKLFNDEKALQYYHAALDVLHKDPGHQPDIEMAGINTSIAGIYFGRGHLDKARTFLDKATPLMPDTMETLVSGAYYHLAGQLALKANKIDSAIYFLGRSLEFYNYTRPMHMDVISAVCADMVRLMLTTGDLAAAKKYADESLSAAHESRQKDVLAGALVAMAEYDNRTGAQSLAYQALRRATILNDSVLKAANIRQTNNLAALYENDKKEKAITQLEADERLQTVAVKQKTLLNIIFLIALITLIVIGISLYLNVSKNRKLERQHILELEKEKQLMGIEAMLKGQEEERHRLARDLHDSLGSMLSGVKISFSNLRDKIDLPPSSALAYTNTLEQLDRTIAEMRKVAHNLMPEALVRFGLKSAVKDFCESIHLAGGTEIICEQFGSDRDLSNIADLNVYRIVQELINNAINHGKAARILVQLTKTNDKILITVEDDGKGFEVDKLKKATGIGWTNIQSRVNYFNGVIDIDSKPTEGTIINIELTA
jgi:two-component system, NarL family, sensor kinase